MQNHVSLVGASQHTHRCQILVHVRGSHRSSGAHLGQEEESSLLTKAHTSLCTLTNEKRPHFVSFSLHHFHSTFATRCPVQTTSASATLTTEKKNKTKTISHSSQQTYVRIANGEGGGEGCGGADRREGPTDDVSSADSVHPHHVCRGATPRWGVCGLWKKTKGTSFCTNSNRLLKKC